MNAPIHPALLAEHALRDLLLRVAEATRLEAAIATRNDVLALRMNGRHSEAVNAYEQAHSAVMRIDLNKLVAEFVIEAPDVAELTAFEAAAKANHTNILRNGAGDFVHPATQRAHAIWKLAIRWARNEHADRPP